jgi:hypothetical protein
MSRLVSLHGLTHFKIPAALPADGTLTKITELAAKTGMHSNDTKTLVRHASSRRFLGHLPGDLVSYSAASKAILAIPALSEVLSCASSISKSLNSVV